MAKKNTCFVIGPIGKPGSQIRQDADDLLDMIIRPALEIYDFKVTRGDHKAMPNQIDVDVIKSVQEADLCIVDLTGLNPNVLYEFGRRDETGKPVILMKQLNRELPVDIATRRCIEFDLNTRHGPRDAVRAIRSFVEPMIDSGFEGDTTFHFSANETAARQAAVLYLLVTGICTWRLDFECSTMRWPD